MVSGDENKNQQIWSAEILQVRDEAKLNHYPFSWYWMREVDTCFFFLFSFPFFPALPTIAYNFFVVGRKVEFEHWRHWHKWRDNLANDFEENKKYFVKVVDVHISNVGGSYFPYFPLGRLSFVCVCVGRIPFQRICRGAHWTRVWFPFRRTKKKKHASLVLISRTSEKLQSSHYWNGK